MPGKYDGRYGRYHRDEIRIIYDRLDDLIEIYKRLKKKKAELWGRDCGFYMNEALLVKVCLLYLNDLKEFKVFHDVDVGTDHYKRAAYLSRLISNVRPIHIRHHVDTDAERLCINEEFAILTFLSYLGIDYEKAQGDSVKTAVEDLMYIFRFRDPQKELLVSLARALEHATSAGNR